MLDEGQNVFCSISKQEMTIEKKLGEGGQGIVYLVRGGAGKKALKWYNAQQATPGQQNSILQLINRGAPRGVENLFVWPEDIALADGEPGFGYIMELIDTDRFIELGKVFKSGRDIPGPVKCRISENVVFAFKFLHLSGYCYRDISDRNLLFDSRTGEVLICDNDNVGLENIKCQISGSIDFMAPEIILGKACPSTRTDLHSLAVLLFNLWIWHHPLEGMAEYAIRSWDEPAKRLVYGEKPVFVFDPEDRSNRLPDDPEYDTARDRWEDCPGELKQLFTKAFTKGLKEPAARVTESEWLRLFARLPDTVVRCSRCNAALFWEDRKPLTCWNCLKPIPVPVRLVVKTTVEGYKIVLTPSTKLYEHHFHVFGNKNKNEGNPIVGEMAQNPADPSIWGLRNLSGSSWWVVMPDGARHEVPPGKSAAVMAGCTIRFGSEAAGTFEQ